MKFFGMSLSAGVLAISMIAGSAKAEIVVSPSSSRAGSLVVRVKAEDRRVQNFDLFYKIAQTDSSKRLTTSWNSGVVNERQTLAPGRYLLEFQSSLAYVEIRAGQTTTVELKRVRAQYIEGADFVSIRNQRVHNYLHRDEAENDLPVALWNTIQGPASWDAKSTFLVLPGTYRMIWYMKGAQGNKAIDIQVR